MALEYRIIDLPSGDKNLREQAAQILFSGFQEHMPNAFPDMQAARKQVADSLQEGWISRIAVDDEGLLLGWIGAVPVYNRRSWVLSPMVVRPEYRERGIGRALVVDLESIIQTPEGVTLHLGTDDEDSQTSLAAIDLYPNVLEHVANIKNLDRHPYEFYQKVGFVIVGVVPDANGPGKPDILMAKRIVTSP